MLLEKSPSKVNTEALSLERDFLLDQVSKLRKENQQLNNDLQRIVDERLGSRIQQDNLRRENAALTQKVAELQHTMLKEKTTLLKQLEMLEADQRQREQELLRKAVRDRSETQIEAKV